MNIFLTPCTLFWIGEEGDPRLPKQIDLRKRRDADGSEKEVDLRKKRDVDGGGRFVGETKCENIPRRICIPNNCRMEESKEEECHNKKSLVLHEIPEEVKDLYFSKKYFKSYNTFK